MKRGRIATFLGRETGILVQCVLASYFVRLLIESTAAADGPMMLLRGAGAVYFLTCVLGVRVRQR